MYRMEGRRPSRAYRETRRSVRSIWRYFLIRENILNLDSMAGDDINKK